MEYWARSGLKEDSNSDRADRSSKVSLVASVSHGRAEELIEPMRQNFPLHYARGQFHQPRHECRHRANNEADNK